MNRRGFIRFALLTALPLTLALSSCFIGNTRDTYADLSTAGFISDDCYQSILDFPPDSDAQGLVKGRESAMKKTKASGIINWMVLDKLVEYRIDRALASSGPEALKKGTDMNALKGALRERIQPFLSYGKVEYSFYREDNTAVIIHRIRRKGLQGRLDGVDIALDEEKKTAQ